MALPQSRNVGLQPNNLWIGADGLRLNRNSPLKALQVGTVTFTAAQVTAATIAEQAITITGTTVNDAVSLIGTGAPTANVNLMGHGRVSAASTVQALYINPTAGNLTPPASQVIFFTALQVQ